MLLSKGYAGENPWLRLRPRRGNPRTVLSPVPVGDEEAANSRPRNAESTDAEHEVGSVSSTDSEIEVEPLMSVAVCLSLLVSVTVVCVTTCAD